MGGHSSFNNDWRCQPDDPGSWIGEEIDHKYKLVRLVGRGGFAYVYQATHQFIGASCAVKIIHALPQFQARSWPPRVPEGLIDSLPLDSFSNHLKSMERFKREARILHELRHPHIVAFRDAGAFTTFVDTGTEMEKMDDPYIGNEYVCPYLVTEFVDGVSLDKLLGQEGSLRSSLVQSIGVAVASALAEAHRHGILHRDIKPQNIMLARLDGRRSSVRVLDFGIASFLSSLGGNGDSPDKLTTTGTVIGTPLYMSPEQMVGRDLDQRSDLYSLGLTLVEMLCGRLPDPGPSQASLYEAKQTRWGEDILTDLGALRPSIPQALRDALAACILPEPDQRPKGADEFLRALRIST